MSHISKNTIHFSWDDVYLTYNLKKNSQQNFIGPS